MAGQRNSRGRLDPLTLLVGVVALVTYALHGFDGYLSRDLAIYGYAGQQVADGSPPYVGILNRAGPLAHLLPALGVAGARVGGLDDLLGMRLLFLVISVACVCVVYLLGRDLFTSRLAGLAAAAAFLSFSGFIEYATNGPREKTAMVLFLVCALWAVKRRRWFTAGVSVSLATLVLQIAFLPGMAAVLVAMIGVRPAARLPALLRVAVGGLVPASVCLVYFTLAGALQEFIDAFLLINARYSSAVPMTSNFSARWSILVGGYGVSLVVMVVGLVALAVLSLVAFRRENRRKDPSFAVSMAAMAAATLVALIWTLRDFDGWPDAFLVLPMAALGIGGLAKLVSDHLSPRAAISLTLVWVVVAVGVAVSFSVGERDHRLVLQRRSVAAVLGQLPSDASLLSLDAAQPLVLSGKSNPTRYLTFTSGMDRYVDDTWPGGLEGFVDWIGREQPTVITVRRGGPRWMANLLESDYRHVGRAPGWVWYVHRSVGPDVLEAARNKARSAGRQ